MLFTLISFTGIALVTAVIIAAVWLLIKAPDPPPAGGAEPLTAGQELSRAILRIVTVLYALLLMPACIVSWLSPFAMVGAGHQSGQYVVFLFLSTFPFTIVAALSVAWILLRRKYSASALLVTLLPIVQVIASFLVPGLWSDF